MRENRGLSPIHCSHDNLAALSNGISKNFSKLSKYLRFGVRIKWREPEMPFSFMVGEHTVHRSSVAIAKHESPFGSQFRSSAKKLPTERDTKFSCIEFALSRKQHICLLWMNVSSPTKLGFGCFYDSNITLVQNTG